MTMMQVRYKITTRQVTLGLIPLCSACLLVLCCAALRRVMSLCDGVLVLRLLAAAIAAAA
jgi:hypothetical protein